MVHLSAWKPTWLGLMAGGPSAAAVWHQAVSQEKEVATSIASEATTSVFFLGWAG